MAKERKPGKPNERARISRINLGTAWEPYDGSQVARDMAERRRKTKHRGIAAVAADFLLNLIAYNLIRIPKLVAA